MKKIIAGLLLLALCCPVTGQNKSLVDQAVEGGKVLVELIKVIGGDRAKEADSGCAESFANLCITNERDSSLAVAITHRTSNETRELVITTGGRECSLQLAIGVWTYELRLRGAATPIRKGDLLIEACQDLEMTVK